MTNADAFTSLAISLALGLLVGLQRQRSEDRLGGLRTFALACLFGTIAGMIASSGPGGSARLDANLVWIPAAGMLALALVLIARGYSAAHAPTASLLPAPPESPLPGVPAHDTVAREAGLTTELALLTMYLVGVLVWTGPQMIAVALGGGVAVLLQAKFALHRFAAKLGENDLTAIFRFVLISLVILPVLPDERIGPYHIFNPHETWLMVVLIVGMSLAGYLAYRLLGDRTGPILTGVLGGIVSSTATTASFARRSRIASGSSNGSTNNPAAASDVHAPVLIVLIAGAVMSVRVLIELAVVAREHFAAIAPPIGIVMGTSLAACSLAWARSRRRVSVIQQQENPAELKAPVVFAIAYTLVQFAAAGGKDWLGPSGLFVVAAISGLTDMDAITLSVGRLAAAGTATTETAWRAVVIALIANMCFKCGIVAIIGSRAMFKLMVLYTAVSIAGAVVVLALW